MREEDGAVSGDAIETADAWRVVDRCWWGGEEWGESEVSEEVCGGVCGVGVKDECEWPITGAYSPPLGTDNTTGYTAEGDTDGECDGSDEVKVGVCGIDAALCCEGACVLACGLK